MPLTKFVRSLRFDKCKNLGLKNTKVLSFISIKTGWREKTYLKNEILIKPISKILINIFKNAKEDG